MLFVDDLVLVSETSSGLKNCLDRLQEYCNKSRLTDNIKKKKKKTMVVEKWKTKPALFTKIVLLICVNLTPILGQYVISHKRQFKFNINELCKKASRAMYILLCNVNTFYAGNIKILKDLFDKMILPICTYNWGMAGFIFQL